METSFITILQKCLVGKKIKHYNNHYREVVLKIENITILNSSRQITPDTKDNDYYGESVFYSEYYINFIDGSKIQVDFETKFSIVE